jgi:hypothetical protein
MPMNIPVMAITGTLKTPTTYKAGNKVLGWGRRLTIQDKACPANKLMSPNPTSRVKMAPTSIWAPLATSLFAVAMEALF